MVEINRELALNHMTLDDMSHYGLVWDIPHRELNMKYQFHVCKKTTMMSSLGISRRKQQITGLPESQWISQLSYCMKGQDARIMERMSKTDNTYMMYKIALLHYFQVLSDVESFTQAAKRLDTC